MCDDFFHLYDRYWQEILYRRFTWRRRWRLIWSTGTDLYERDTYERVLTSMKNIFLSLKLKKWMGKPISMTIIHWVFIIYIILAFSILINLFEYQSFAHVSIPNKSEYKYSVFVSREWFQSTSIDKSMDRIYESDSEKRFCESYNVSQSFPRSTSEQNRVQIFVLFVSLTKFTSDILYIELHLFSTRLIWSWMNFLTKS